MYRTVPYIVLFLILALLQIFLFDNLSISIYLCPFGLYRLHCPAADRRSAGCSAFSGFVDVRCDGLGDGGSGDQYDRYASGRYAAPAASAVCLR